MQLATLLSLRIALPSVPRVEALLLGELVQPEPDLRRVVQWVNTDPALTLRLLMAANAPVFKLSRQVHSASEALAVLGLVHAHKMVAAAAANPSFRVLPGLSMPQFWSYSLDCAKVARSIAKLLRLNQQAAYSCGLIHGLGALLLRAATPEAQALDAQLPALALQRDRLEVLQLGFCATQVTAGLARQGDLPTLMADALQYQHAPFDNEAYEPLAGVLHLAVWRARARQAGLSGNALTVTFPSAVAEVLELDIDMVLQQDPIDWHAQPPGRLSL